MTIGKRGFIGMMVGAVAAGLGLFGCAGTGGGGDGGGGGSRDAGAAGRLILIGGALDGKNQPVFARMLELARGEDGVARIVVATAASLNEAPAYASISERLRVYDAAVELTTIGRETAPADAVTRIRAARLAFFTGGDQKRIVDLYRKEGTDGVEAAALRELLARGGTIAGTSAGDAMMSDPMFLSGGSDEALGMREGKGVQIGKGMGFLPGMIADSHFFERDRLGRLVAALETSGVRWGLGVGEDAAVEVDVATMTLTRLSEQGVLLVDCRDVKRDGLSRTEVRATAIPRGRAITLAAHARDAATGRRLPPTGQELGVFRPARGPDGPAASLMLFEPSGAKVGREVGRVRELVCGRHVVRATELSFMVGAAPASRWFDVEIHPAALPQDEVPQGD